MFSCSKRFPFEIFFVVLFTRVFPGIAADDYQSAIRALSSGKTVEAKTTLSALYKKNPTDPLIKFHYAITMPCSTALILYQELCKTENTPDSVKAGAYCRIGDYYFATKEYSKAMEQYRLASLKQKDSLYKHKLALAAMSSGDFEAAKTIWLSLTVESAEQVSQKSYYYLGLLNLKQNKIQEAYDCFLKSGKTDSKNSWTVAALACKYECASRLGMADNAKVYKDQLAVYKNTLFESEILQPLVVVEKKTQPDSVSVNSAVSVDSLPAFTLQVGAFGSIENASNLQKTLNKIFKDVTVLAVTLDERVFYRVRVGTFSSREDADVFGNDSLLKSGYRYKVVQK